MGYQEEAIRELADKILEAGHRPFIAKRGTYGFFTNQEGTRVVTFQCDLGAVKFAGTYVSEDGRRTGAGWQLEGSDFTTLLNEPAPHWAHQGVKFRYATLKDHLERYQSSSRYAEIGKPE